MVIASTNRPFDLDEAVLRRLPRRIMVDLPDLETRIDILNVTLASNAIATDVNMTAIATELEGYSGSDIKEVCREAVVRVSHERASLLESSATSSSLPGEDEDEKGDGGKEEDGDITGNLFELRPVNATDFKEAMRKLKASVDESGRELQKVIEWNEKYGELKRSSGSGRLSSRRSSQHLSMYI